MKGCSQFFRSDDKSAWETVDLIGFGSAVAKAVGRAGQEHVNEVTFEYCARPGLDLALTNNCSPGSYRSDVY
jgi:hypothetical protein